MVKTPFEQLPKKYKDLVSVLRTGSENALSSAEIMQITGISGRDTGAITADLIANHGYLIGASRKLPFGYYIIETEDDLQSTLRSLNNELQGILNRHQALNRNFYAGQQ